MQIPYVCKWACYLKEKAEEETFQVQLSFLNLPVCLTHWTVECIQGPCTAELRFSSRIVKGVCF